MQFSRAVIAGLGALLPEEEVSSAAIEAKLFPIYERIGLEPGRLELMTGIRHRRWFAPGTTSSEVAAEAGRRALVQADLPRDEIDAVIYAGVCRDYVEPATANFVHHKLEIGAGAQLFDLSNACLGVMDAVLLAARLVEAGQWRSALVVSGEDGRTLVENTIRHLNRSETLTRKTIKPHIATLTIGSAAAAVLVTSQDRAPDGHAISGCVHETRTEAAMLCRGQVGAQGLLMETDAERLLHEGIALATHCFAQYREQFGPSSKYITHQVGRAHFQALSEALELDGDAVYRTYPFLGNVGSAALPASLALAAENNFIESGDTVGLLGIGSGLSCMMMNVRW